MQSAVIGRLGQFHHYDVPTVNSLLVILFQLSHVHNPPSTREACQDGVVIFCGCQKDFTPFVLFIHLFFHSFLHFTFLMNSPYLILQLKQRRCIYVTGGKEQKIIIIINP